jgi:hypothetical protein
MGIILKKNAIFLKHKKTRVQDSKITMDQQTLGHQ